MYLNPPKTENKPDEAPTLEHVDFAAAMTADVFGRSYVAPDARAFRDRPPPETVAPATRMQFHVGRHRRFPSWRTAG